MSVREGDPVAVGNYDVLHEGVPAWLSNTLHDWVFLQLTAYVEN